jgi:hypothetical protein
MKRGRKANNGITFIPKAKMKSFLNDIKAHMKELHVAIQCYENELVQQGYSPDEASLMVAKECMAIKRDIVHEDSEGIL